MRSLQEHEVVLHHFQVPCKSLQQSPEILGCVMQTHTLSISAMSQGAAAKGKRGRSKGKEDSPALQPTRVSKRQKAKAEAQAADAAQQEEDDQELEGEDPFSGAATQVSECSRLIST